MLWRKDTPRGKERQFCTLLDLEPQKAVLLPCKILDVEPQKTVLLPCKVLDFEPQQEALAGYKDGENLTTHIQTAQVQHIYCNLHTTSAAVSNWYAFASIACAAGTLGGARLLQSATHSGILWLATPVTLRVYTLQRLSLIDNKLLQALPEWLGHEDAKGFRREMRVVCSSLIKQYFTGKHTILHHQAFLCWMPKGVVFAFLSSIVYLGSLV